MPGSKIGHSDAASIENGFKKGVFCYITTAVCKSLNKPDDCYELNLLREYRDQYLMGTKDGEILVKEYYNIAPTIVKRIDRSPDASEIYADIWEKYLKPCVRLIEAGEQEECRELYTKMVRSLEKKYLYSVGGEKNVYNPDMNRVMERREFFLFIRVQHFDIQAVNRWGVCLT